MDRPVDVVFCSGVILGTIDCIVYIVLSGSKFDFPKLPIEKESLVQAPLTIYISFRNLLIFSL